MDGEFNGGGMRAWRRMRRTDGPAGERHQHHCRVEQEVGEVRGVAFPRLHSRRMRRRDIEQPPRDPRHGKGEHRETGRCVQHHCGQGLNQLDYEAELAFVIGTRCRHASVLAARNPRLLLPE